MSKSTRNRTVADLSRVRFKLRFTYKILPVARRLRN